MQIVLNSSPSIFLAKLGYLNQRLGKGESEAIALGIELDADYVLLDDSTARREARRLGLNIRGTLAVIKKLSQGGKISIESLNDLYQQLIDIGFRSSGLYLIESFLKTKTSTTV